MPLVLTSNKTSAEKLPSAAQPKNRTNRQKAPIQHLNPGIPRRFAIYPNPNCLRYFLSPPLARVENAQPIPGQGCGVILPGLKFHSIKFAKELLFRVFSRCFCYPA